MLKHVQLSPYRTRAADSLNLNARSTDSMRSHLQCSIRSRQDSLGKRDECLDTVSLSSTTSLSPEPMSSLLSSRSSSYCSLSDASLINSSPTVSSESKVDQKKQLPLPRESRSPSGRTITNAGGSYSFLSDEVFHPLNRLPAETTIKVYAKCLRSDIEYKTLGITYQTTCREVVSSLLKKYRMRHRDPNLYYLTMEVTVRKAGLRTVLALDEEARPAALQSCHPRGDSKFSLQMRRGGLVKVYDSVLMPGSQYKSLLISERTTVDELIQILLNCYNSRERVEQFCLYEVCEDEELRRKLHPDDCPLQLQHTWLRDRNFHFLIRRNSDYRHTKNSLSSGDDSCGSCSSKSIRNDPRSSFASSSLSSSSSTSSDGNTNRFSCYSEYDNFFYI